MTKPPRYWIRLTIALLKRFKLIFLGGMFLGVVFFIFMFRMQSLTPTDSRRIGIVGEYTTDSLPNFITNLISTGLTTLDASGKAFPAISEKYEVSDAGKTWTFHLNKNLKWQDGSEITSDDLNYNFSDATVTKPDKYTIVFKLKTALAPFAATVSKPIFKKGLLGTGKWKVTDLTLAGSYIETLTLLDHNSNKKMFKFYPTEERAKLAYELGEIDELDNLTDVKPFDSWKVAAVTANIDKQKYVAVFFNTSDQLLTDKDIRQALSYSIDKKQFGTNRAFGPISPNSWAYNPSLKMYDQDNDHAKELISESKIDPTQKKNLKITLTTIPSLLTMADEIAKEWEQIGVHTTVQVTSFVPEEYQAFLAIYDISLDPDQYITWHSTQTATNITHYKNARIDKLLEDGRLENSEIKRKGIYFDFQKFLVEDSPAVFLYYPTYFSVSRK